MKNKGFTIIEIMIVVAILGILSAILLSVINRDKIPSVEIKDSNGIKIEIANIDNCEYIKNKTADNYFVYTHKGNCKNPIHRR